MSPPRPQPDDHSSVSGHALRSLLTSADHAGLLAMLATDAAVGEQVGVPVRGGPRPAIPEVFKTKVVTRGVDVTVNAFYKHSRIKQYLNDGRALRVETSSTTHLT